MTNEHKADKQAGAAPAQGVTRRDFLRRATRAVIGGGILVGALAAPAPATAGQKCSPTNTCQSNQCTFDYCGNSTWPYSGSNTCTASDVCDDNTCYGSDGCLNYNMCEGGSNTCETSHTCNADQCTATNDYCIQIDSCYVNACPISTDSCPGTHKCESQDHI